jgi:hypothetical protein
VTFTVYPNADCTGTATVLSPVSLDANGKALSPIRALGATGLGYRAVYGGDSVYNGSETSRCEPVCAVNSAIQ